MRIGGRITLVFSVALVALAALAGLLWRGASQYAETVHLVGHTHEVLRVADLAFENLVDVESAARGFVITGQADFLTPYERARVELPHELERLRGLVADNAQQTSRAEALSELARRRIERAEQLVTLRRASGFAAAAEEVRRGRGQALMAETRRTFAALRGEELRLLDERTALMSRRARLAMVLIGGAVLVVAVLLVAAIAWLTRSITFPLRALVRNARELGVGRETAIAALAQADEIGELARAMDEMARRRAEAEAQRRELLDDAPIAFFLADLDGVYTDANAAACELLGYRREELLGMRIVDTLAPEEVERLAADKQRLLTPGWDPLESTCRHASLSIL